MKERPKKLKLLNPEFESYLKISDQLPVSLKKFKNWVY
ncbi:hypothetical protein C723_1469 [Christiangramia flava JLT2011]|nr:hypothetical protein C723_1469 [Christiangramia flava JLT2011]